MVSSNPAFQVLVTSGNQAVAAAGLRLDQLKAGQVGVFNYHTNLTIDGTKLAENRNFYIAVGISRSGAAGTNAEDVKKSRGNSIEKRGIKAFSTVLYKAPQNKVFVVTINQVLCASDYALKLEFRGEETRRSYGFNNPSKTYTGHSGCCTDQCEPCAGGDVDTVIRDLAYNINNDDEGLLVAEMLDGNTVVPDSGYDAWKATAGNVDKNLKLRIAVLSAKTTPFLGSINPSYLNSRSMTAELSLIGLECKATFEVTQEAAFEQGLGYDLRELEYVANGWDKSPYRLSENLGQEINSAEYFVTPTGKYTTFNIEYQNKGIGGGLPYETSLQTIIGVPQADVATFDDLKEILHRIIDDATGDSATVDGLFQDEFSETFE